MDAAFEDDELARRSRSGDPRALATLYRRHAPALMEYLRRLCGNPADAEDVLQETFLRVFEGRGRYSGRGRFRSWLFTIATRLAHDRHRRRRRQSGLTAEDVIRITPNAQGKQTPGPQGNLSDLAPEELVTRVIAAQNVDSAELVKILRPLIPQYGQLAAVAEPNIVIINDHADNIQRLIKIIEQIDVADEDEIVMVQLEHAWVGTVVAMLERVAPDQIGQSAVGPQRINLVANERNNTLVVRGKSLPVAEGGDAW